MIEMQDQIKKFAKCIADGSIEIYNEFSLQHELGIFLRQTAYQSHKVQFERNVAYFGFTPNNFVKKEIDISVFQAGNNLKAAFELKYPTNGQYPMQMHSFCRDIQFLEELKLAGFQRAFLLILADDHLFYSGSSDGIYGFFRSKRPLTGTIKKPIRGEPMDVTIKGSYTINWEAIIDNLKYSLIEV